jgi:hypothetical protein
MLDGWFPPTLIGLPAYYTSVFAYDCKKFCSSGLSRDLSQLFSSKGFKENVFVSDRGHIAINSSCQFFNQCNAVKSSENSI